MIVPNIDQEIINLLQDAIGSKIENFELLVHDSEKSDGYLGETTFISLKNKNNGKDYDFVVKQVFPSKTQETKAMMTALYFNEIHYYTKVFPALENVQKSYPEVRKFNNYATCYATSLKPGFEKLVLDNLKTKNYEMYPKMQHADQKLCQDHFKVYADLHAAGYALKYHQPESFAELTKVLPNNWLKVNKMGDFLQKFFKIAFNTSRANLKGEGDEKLLLKFEKYLQEAYQIFEDAVTYNGLCGTILHGDCWSNNFMFKYNASREVEDIKMLDFQFGMVGSPIIDLSYNFYASAGKESLDKLEDLLKFYHKNLSENLKKYGCDPEKIYPFETLKKEWKKHCHFGFQMALMVWKTKLNTDLSNRPTAVEMMESEKQVEEGCDDIQYDEEKYRNISVDLIRHMSDNDLL